MNTSIPDEKNFNFEGLIAELRSLRGALNARSAADESPILVEIATLKAQVQHLQTSIRELRMALWGLTAGVLGMVIKIVFEGGFGR